ncbi:MAG TPA: FAD-binding oxidoreductase [Gaiellaceae bacterium]|nr:FAD-binding oxidoreductase [Gaiellaceae bacterium]
METTARGLERKAIAALAGELQGQLIAPGDAAYEEARRVWNGSVDRRPAVIARCAGVADVIATLGLAREAGLPVAVRGGGHSVAGFGTCEGGVVVDLSRMQTVAVDAEARTAVAEGGTVGAVLDRETQAYGLATTLGIVSTTGVAGLTLGGGIGWMQRKHGFAADNLLSADVVTADGELVRASADENADLFWGVRGGGGNFGVVTSFTYRLHPVGPELLCGLVAWPAAQTRDVLRLFRSFMADAPDEVMAIAILRTAPPAPFLPEAVHGRPIAAIACCYVGPPEEGADALAPLRALGAPVGDALTVRPYTAFQSMFDASWTPGFHNYWKAEYLTGIPDEGIDSAAHYALSHSSPLSDFKFAALGGAVARVGEDETATGFRQAPFVLNVNTRWADPAESERHVAHTRELYDSFLSHSAGGVYVNFLGDEGEERVRAAYGDARLERLRQLKRRYDPDNVFRFNQNIRP